MLAACGDPLSKVDKLSSVELAPNTETVMALPDPAKQVRAGGLFSGLFNRDPAPVSNTPAIAQTDAAVSEALGVATPAVAPAVQMLLRALRHHKLLRQWRNLSKPLNLKDADCLALCVQKRHRNQRNLSRKL